MPDSIQQETSGPAPGAASRSQSLSRKQRLSLAADFQEAFTGEAFAGRFLVLRLRRGPAAALRLGVIAGKRALNRSVDRTRAKRLLREAYRLNRARLAGACDVVLIARSMIRGATRQDVEEDFLKQARRAGLMARKTQETDHA